MNKHIKLYKCEKNIRIFSIENSHSTTLKIDYKFVIDNKFD